MVPSESPRGPQVRELESLRIARPEKPRKSILLPAALLAVALVAAGAGAYVAYNRTLGRPLEVQIAVVALKQSGQSGVLLTGSGYIVTQHKYIVVGTKVLGQIVEEPIEEGQHVRKGDLLARIDDRDYQAQLRQAVANRNLAAANFSLKAAQVRRLRELYRNNVESKDALDIAENAFAVAQAQLQQANAAVDYAQFDVGQCVITSPIDGIVLQKYRELGDTINYGGEIQAGGGATDIVQLADTSDMRTEVDVNESDIAKVTMGEPATVVPDAYPDKSFDARVVKIYPEADRQKGTIEVEVRILHPDMNIVKPEMSAKVSFLSNAARSQTPMVLVPKKAIVGVAGSAWVWRIQDGTATRVPIVPGTEFQDGVAIRSGLTGGELLIVSPPTDLKEGQTVIAAAP